MLAETMSKIISFSADNQFSDNLEDLMNASGYQNRSRFLRDAALYFAEIQQRGELKDMDDEERTKWILNYVRAMQQELAELTVSLDLNLCW